MKKEELSFTIYCVGILAERLGITERNAYHLLQNCNYLVDNLNREYHLGKYA